jgi:hypothetical protein
MPNLIEWCLESELAVGQGHPTEPDVINRPLRQFMEFSGFDPDSSFGGFYGPVYNLLSFRTNTGVDIGDGINDATQTFQDAFDGTPDGSALFIPYPSNFYKLTNKPILAKNMYLVGQRSKIKQTVAGLGGISIIGSGAHLYGLDLEGVQFASSIAGENAIEIIGASAASPCRDIRIEFCKTHGWGNAGIWLEHVEDFEVFRCRMQDIYKYGVIGLSAIDGDVGNNRVTNIVGTPLGYGMTFTRNEVDSLVTRPRSRDVLVHHNRISNVLFWEGLDTHGGQRIHFLHNSVLGCYVGIAVPRADGSGSVPMYAPLDCTVHKNYINSLATDGSKGYGIVMAGVVAGELATGDITENIVVGHGDEDVPTSGGIVVFDSLGMRLASNIVRECSPHGITMYARNTGLSIDDNTIIDPWSATIAESAAIAVKNNDNDGAITNNRLVDGTKSATFVNQRGLSVDFSTNVSLLEHSNEFSSAVTSIVGMNLGTRKKHNLGRYTGGGSSHVAGDYVLSAGWGDTAIVASVTAHDTGGRVNILCQGAGIGANPTIVLTFKDGAWSPNPIQACSRGDVVAPSTGYWVRTGASTTTFTWVFVGTPISGNQYSLDFIVTGR